MPYSATYAAFLKACSQPGCPICRVEHDAVTHYLDGLFYEQVNDPGMRARLRASLGFCAEHAFLAMDDMQGNALGLAIIYDDMLRVALEQLGQHTPGAMRETKCPACEQRDEVTQRALSELAKHIQEAEASTALQKSEGLCLPHMKQGLQHMRIPEKQKVLLLAQREIIERLRGELAEFIRKNDYRFAGEPFGAERDAWRRAVAIVAGTKRQAGDKR